MWYTYVYIHIDRYYILNYMCIYILCINTIGIFSGYIRIPDQGSILRAHGLHDRVFI